MGLHPDYGRVGAAPAYGPSVQTHLSAPLYTERTLSCCMYEGVAELFQGLGTWLQSVSPYVPISQLSILTWVIVMVSQSFASKDAFNTHEQAG